MELKDVLRELSNIATPKELADAAKAKGLKVTQAMAKAFLEQQGSIERFRRISKKKFFIPIVAPPFTYQIDTAFIDDRPVLVMVEITSRKVYTELLKGNAPNAETTAAALEHMIEKIRHNGEQIHAIESDSGVEFQGRFATVLKKNNIDHLVYPKTDNKNTALAKVERMNGTLRGFYEKAKEGDRVRLSLLKGEFAENPTPELRQQINQASAPKPISQRLPEVTTRYNNRTHSATKLSPNQFTSDDFAPQYGKEAARAIRPNKLLNESFQVGARVRIANEYNLFEKGAKPTWSQGVYTIKKREGFSFFVEDAKGRMQYTKAGKEKPFRGYELQLTNEKPKIAVEAEPKVQEEVPEPLLSRKSSRPAKPKVNSEPEEPKRVREARPKGLTGRVLTKGQQEAFVEAILDYRRTKGKLELLTKYAGFKRPSFQPLDNFYSYLSSGEKVLHPLVTAFIKAKKLKISAS